MSVFWKVRPDQMNLIQKILTRRVENANQVLFDLLISDDLVVNQYIGIGV